MSVLSSLIDMVTGGGFTTLVSGFVSMWFKQKTQEKTDEQTQWQLRYEITRYRMQAEHEAMLAEKELLISVEAGKTETFVAAIQADMTDGSRENISTWVNNIRSLHRLVLTYLLVIAVIFMYTYSGAMESVSDRVSSQMQIIAFVTNAAGVAIGFWFGDRMTSRTNNTSQ